MVFTIQKLNNNTIETTEVAFLSENNVWIDRQLWMELENVKEMWKAFTNQKLFKFIILDDLKVELGKLDYDIRDKEIELEVEDYYMNVIIKEDCHQHCWGQIQVKDYGLVVLGENHNKIYCVTSRFINNDIDNVILF